MSLLAFLVLVCLVVPPLLPAQWMANDLENRFGQPGWPHLLGTDDLGRDALHRLLLGGRVSLIVGLVGALAATFLGTAVGAAAGLRGGWIDSLLMRAADGFLALPLLPLMILLSATNPTSRLAASLGIDRSPWFQTWVDPSLVNILVLVAAFGWMTTARLVRASILVLKELDFVQAARALGASETRIAVVHLIPNALAPILVAVTLTVGRVILYESVLSFLGLGIQPPTPTWGNALTTAQDSLWKAPWLAISPGIFILTTVVSVNFVGDGLRDAFDPRARR